MTILDALRDGVLDPELAALLWLLLEGGIGCVVAGPGDGPADRASRSTVLQALLDLVPAGRAPRRLGGLGEDFTWLADAESLGWRRTLPADPSPADPSATLVLGGELGGPEPDDTTGDRARLAIRAIGRGYSLVATVRSGRLEEVLDGLRRRPVQVTDDELSRLGVVLVLAPGPQPRVGVAHYLRPLARDVHGHPQRLPPAVLAAWDEGQHRFEHFAWGVTSELAIRIGRKPGDLDVERERRSVALAALAAGTRPGPALRAGDPADPTLRRAAVRAALERIRATETATPPGHRH